MTQIRPEEISALIKEQIKNYDQKIHSDDLEEDHIGAVLLGNDTLIKEGDEVRRTGRIVEVPVGDGLLGRVVNALGQPIDNKGEIAYTKTRAVERVAPGVMTRKSVFQPLMTGLKIIDSVYTQDVELETLVPETMMGALKEKITEATGGKARFMDETCVKYAFKDQEPVFLT